MMHVFKRAWSDILLPIFVNPRERQVAALCYREGTQGKEVLLITSRDTGRWIIPKGWLMDGKTDADAAAQEAWEEAGVRAAEVAMAPMGHYVYEKAMNSEPDIPIWADVYLIRVAELADDFPEVDERTRRWFDPLEAADLVDEPDLQAILRAF